MINSLKLMAMLTVLSISNVTAQQCEYGDCQNSFGVFASPEWAKIGFFSGGKLNGPANHASQNDYYSGHWKDGKKNGFFLYIDNGAYKFGHFVNDVKHGDHITFMAYDRERFENGVSKEKVTFKSNGGTTGCIFGDCDNGYGVKREGTATMAGFWKGGNLHGIASVSDMGQGITVYGEFTDGMGNGATIAQSVQGMVMIGSTARSAKNGQYVTLNHDGSVRGQIFENNVAKQTF